MSDSVGSVCSSVAMVLIENMRALSAQDIVQNTVPEMVSKDVDNDIATMPFLFVDEESLPQCIWCAFAEDEEGSSVHKDVALMIGTNQNETSSGAISIFHLNTTDAYKAWVEKTFDPENAEKVFSVLPGSPDPSIQSTALQTAIQVGAPSNFVADRNSILGNPTFMYYFTQAPNTTDGKEHGAYHGEFSH